MSIREILDLNNPPELAKSLEDEYLAAKDKFKTEDWQGLHVKAGRFCEAVLRLLEWRTKGIFTPIDGHSKPNRKTVVGLAANDKKLYPSLRFQIPQAVELILDFRNNRNAAHLGTVDLSSIDGTTVFQLMTWVIVELIRIDNKDPKFNIKAVLNKFPDSTYAPIIHEVEGRPIVLDTTLSAADKAVIILHHKGVPLPNTTLRDWSDYRNQTLWNKSVIGKLKREKKVFVDKEANIHLLPYGSKAAEKIILSFH